MTRLPRVLQLPARLVSQKLGRCPKCWRLSFRCAIGAWGVTAGAYLLRVDPRAWLVCVLCAAAFSVWWLLHLVTFGARVVVWERSGRRTHGAEQAARPDHASGGRVPVDSGEHIARRRMLVTFCRSVAWAAAVSGAASMLAACGGGGGGGTGGTKSSGCPCTSPTNVYCASGTVATGCYSSCPSGCTQCFQYLNC